MNPKENTSENEFLQELNQQQDGNEFIDNSSTDPFDHLNEGNEGTQGGDESADKDEKLAFHQDPKVQRYIQKQVDRALKNVTPVKTEEDKFREDLNQGAESDELQAILETLIGNDTPEKRSIVKDFNRVLTAREENSVKKALSQVKADEAARKKQEDDAVAELEQGLEDVEDTYGVDLSSNSPLARKTRTEFLEFVRKIAPKSRDGGIVAYPEMESAYELFQATRKKPDNTRNKQVADRTTQRSNEATVPQPTAKETNWSAVDRMLERFTR